MTISRRTTHPALYRVYQFFIALKASLPAWAGGVRDHLTADDEALVNAILPIPLQQQLFARMPPNDQRHAMAVANTLSQAGHSHPALMQAALLHDVGKSVGQPIIHRVLIVLFEAFWPAALRRLSTPAVSANLQDKGQQMTNHSVGWWRRPFVVHAQHPTIGAAWAREAGCDPLAVSLIAQHQDKLGDEAAQSAEQKLLAALQWADNLN